MRIAIIAPGTRGDVQPYIALGKGLQRAGHYIRLVTHLNFEDLVCAHGLEFWPMAGDVQAIVQSETMQARIEQGNFISLIAQMAKESKLAAVQSAQDALAAAREMELVLAGMGGIFTGFAIAEKLKLPCLQAYLVPFTPTRQFASVLVPTLPGWLGTAPNRVSHHLTRQVMWQGLRSADALARQKVLNLPPAPRKGPFDSECTRGLPVLYGFSPAVIPAPPDWGPEIIVTGYWFLDAASEWSPPRALIDFLEAGPPPVYVGFGSMSSRNPEAAARLVLEALHISGQRAVLLSGWGGLRQDDLPASVLMLDSIPHAWLFPRMAAVVHHGGAGTTAAGLMAGVPSLVIPFFGDQPFWGRRIAELGVGPQPIPRKKLTAERLAQSILQAVTDPEIRQKAAALGAKIQAEDGTGRAAALISQLSLNN
jgi:sterol 3beta-glucosyltransferase